MEVRITQGNRWTLYQAQTEAVFMTKGADQMLVERDGQPMYGADASSIFLRLLHPDNVFILED